MHHSSSRPQSNDIGDASSRATDAVVIVDSSRRCVVRCCTAKPGRVVETDRNMNELMTTTALHRNPILPPPPETACCFLKPQAEKEKLSSLQHSNPTDINIINPNPYLLASQATAVAASVGQLTKDAKVVLSQLVPHMNKVGSVQYG